MTNEELKELASEVLTGKCRSYVDAARVFAGEFQSLHVRMQNEEKLVTDYCQMFRNLTDVQQRCTELKNEVRALQLKEKKDV
jgi:hypothetical protein